MVGWVDWGGGWEGGGPSMEQWWSAGAPWSAIRNFHRNPYKVKKMVVMPSEFSIETLMKVKSGGEVKGPSMEQ